MRGNAVTRIGVAVLVGLLASVGLAQAQQGAEWTPYREGILGPRLASAGTMPDGLPVYVCTAPYQGGIHPGLTGVWTDRCIIAFGGREFHATFFKVFSGRARWVSFRSGGAVPANAIQGGQEADGRPLYVCRTRHEGAMLSGKYRPGFRGCNVADGGREVSLAPFDILTR